MALRLANPFETVAHCESGKAPKTRPTKGAIDVGAFNSTKDPDKRVEAGEPSEEDGAPDDDRLAGGVFTQTKVVADRLVQSGRLGNKGVRKGTSRSDRGLEEKVLRGVTQRHECEEQEKLDGVVGGIQRADLVEMHNHVDGQPSVETRVDDQTVDGGGKESHVDLNAPVDSQVADGLRIPRRLCRIVEVERSQEIERDR